MKRRIHAIVVQWSCFAYAVWRRIHAIVVQ
jgi:hypothetical protein